MKYLKFKCEVKNEHGLHARPATKLCDICKSYERNITIKYKKLKADGKSIVDILTLGAIKGSELEFIVEYKKRKDKKIAESLKDKIYNAFASEFEN